MALPPIDPRNNEFWERENDLLYDELDELLLAIYLAGAASGEEVMPAGAAALVNYDIINEDALAFLRRYRLSTVSNITDTTRTAVITEIDTWIRGRDPFKTLISRLERLPQLSSTRAEMIGVTEVTRIYSEGNLSAWKATGMVSAKRWETSNDEKVCPICRPLHGKVYDINAPFELTQEEIASSPAMRALVTGKDAEARRVKRAGPLLRQFNNQGQIQGPPAHPRCRCRPMPVVSEAGVRAAIRSTFDADALLAEFFGMANVEVQRA